MGIVASVVEQKLGKGRPLDTSSTDNTGTGVPTQQVYLPRGRAFESRECRRAAFRARNVGAHSAARLGVSVPLDRHAPVPVKAGDRVFGDWAVGAPSTFRDVVPTCSSGGRRTVEHCSIPV